MDAEDSRSPGCSFTPEAIARWRARGWGKAGDPVPVVIGVISEGQKGPRIQQELRGLRFY